MLYWTLEKFYSDTGWLLPCHIFLTKLEKKYSHLLSLNLYINILSHLLLTLTYKLLWLRPLRQTRPETRNWHRNLSTRIQDNIPVKFFKFNFSTLKLIHKNRVGGWDCFKTTKIKELLCASPLSEWDWNWVCSNDLLPPLFFSLHSKLIMMVRLKDRLSFNHRFSKAHHG